MRIATLALTAFIALPALAGGRPIVTTYGPGLPPGYSGSLTRAPYVVIAGVSANGAIMSGYLSASGPGYIFTTGNDLGGAEAVVLTRNGVAGIANSAFALDVNDGGTAVGGLWGEDSCYPDPYYKPAMWIRGSGSAPFPGAYGVAWAVSDNGGTVVGQSDVDWPGELGCFPVGWRLRNGVLTVLGMGVAQAGATAVSGDGNVVVGFWFEGGTIGDPNVVARWTGEATTPELLPISVLAYSFVHPAALSYDGAIIVGGDLYNFLGGWRWTDSEGLQLLPGVSFANCCSANGELVGGWTTGPGRGWIMGGGVGVLWDSDHGTRSVSQVLVDDYGMNAADLPAFGSGAGGGVTGISANGKVIVGTTMVAGGSFGWRIELPVSFPADFNNDGSVNGADLAVLLGAWGSSRSLADLDGDGIVGASDLAMLLGAWTS